jgi:hypothetical protein
VELHPVRPLWNTTGRGRMPHTLGPPLPVPTDVPTDPTKDPES